MDLNAGRLVAINVLAEPYHNNLADTGHIKWFLDDLIDAIGMMPLADVQFFEVQPSPESIQDAFADDGGLTAQVVISTSHVAYHSWPLQDRFRLVVDSCKDFQAAIVESKIRAAFPVKSLSIQDLPYAPPNWTIDDEKRATEEERPTTQATQAS